ncbi:MAG TPA: hypothetical protein VHE37_11030 [Nevskiaceae bacterium]|nr:hypothetical protein [Nevskiaceae bacterium]
MTTSGSVTTILNVTLVVNGESVTVDISFDSDSNQVTITRA